MPKRNLVFANDEVYHIFNHSVGGEEIFTRKNYLLKIIKTIEYYRFSQELRLSKFETLPYSLKTEYLNKLKKKIPLVEIYAFAFMPNHYHLLIKQLQEMGIRKFIANIQNSFARIFNLKNNRVGAVFKNPFKAKRIETEEEFVHISRYIHLNPVTSYLIEFKELKTSPWTSFPIYMREKPVSFVNTNFLLGIFGSKKEYLSFLKDQVGYQRELAFIKNLILE